MNINFNIYKLFVLPAQYSYKYIIKVAEINIWQQNIYKFLKYIIVLFGQSKKSSLSKIFNNNPPGSLLKNDQKADGGIGTNKYE
jgi:hypothetical protein